MTGRFHGSWEALSLPSLSYRSHSLSNNLWILKFSLSLQILLLILKKKKKKLKTLSLDSILIEQGNEVLVFAFKLVLSGFFAQPHEASLFLSLMLSLLCSQFLLSKFSYVYFD
jgi:hypothetical protein